MSPLDGKRYTPATGASAQAEPPRAVLLVPEAELVLRFSDRLRLFATRRLRDAAAAEDVAQETLRRVIDAMRAGRIENPLALPGFVFQTASHVCLQHQRSAGREARALARLHDEPTGGAEAPDALVALISEERRATVRAALDRLADSDRELLRLYFFERLDASEIAGRLGMPAAALRVRKHRALHRLAKLLDEREP
ncbi:MAG: sigma-70 family RNA polymerase sigma factor [Gemmatimonadaceae bacterium]